MLDKEQIKKNFSRSAPDYERHAQLQNGLADELFSSLDGFEPKRVLDLGCGTGYLTRKLAEKFPAAEVMGIDIAPGMIEVANNRNKRKNLKFAVGDGESISFGDGIFDVLVSNASLQWMNMGKVLGGARRALQSGGRFVFNTFGPQTLKELKASGFHVNEFLSVNQLIELADRHFKIIEIKSRVISQRFGNVKELVCHLREIGAQNPGSNPKADALRAIKRYRERHSLGEYVIASYEVISGYLTKP